MLCYPAFKNKKEEALRGKVASPSRCIGGGPAVTQSLCWGPGSGRSRGPERRRGHSPWLCTPSELGWHPSGAAASPNPVNGQICSARGFKRLLRYRPAKGAGCPGAEPQAAHSCPPDLSETPQASKTYRHGGCVVVSDGFHKTQRLWSGRSNVVYASLMEPADGCTLVGGHEFPMEPAQDEGRMADSTAFSGSHKCWRKNSLACLYFYSPAFTRHSLSF